MNFWLIQLIGLMGNLTIMLALQINNRKLILCAQGLACLFWSIHFFLLGAPTAAWINFISLGRSIVFYFNDRKWARSMWVFWGFIAVFVLNSVLTWEGWQSILPCIGMCATTLALWTKHMKRTRMCYLCSSPPWLTYDLISGSYSCALMEFISLISYIVAVIRFDRKISAHGKSETAETAEGTEV